jgi:hypothetical protein
MQTGGGNIIDQKSISGYCTFTLAATAAGGGPIMWVGIHHKCRQPWHSHHHCQQPTTNNQQPTTNNQQPTTNNQQPTTNNQQQKCNESLPDQKKKDVHDGGICMMMGQCMLG